MQPLARKKTALASSSLQLSHNLAAHFEQAPLYLPQNRPVGAVTFQNAELRQRGQKAAAVAELAGAQCPLLTASRAGVSVATCWLVATLQRHTRTHVSQRADHRLMG